MSRHTLPLALSLIACTSSAPEPGKPAAPVEAEAKSEPERPAGACGQRIADYLAAREQLSRCETDSDCAEIEPVLALEREIMAKCTIPECEPPMELGIAHCEQGTCARGREEEREQPPKGIKHMSCWDYRETWLEADGAATATTSKTINGVTPLLAIAPAGRGTLTLELDWPAKCTDCRLSISEHNSGMANLITPKATRSEATRNGEPVQRERLEFPVTPGPYWFVGMAGTDTDFTIGADLRDSDGQPGRVTRHGVGWQHMCEG